MAEFILRTPGQPDQAIPLGDRPVLFGRGDGCDVQLLEKKASKRHFRCVSILEPDGRRSFVVEDLQSSNGTLVEEVRVLRWGLTSGDIVRVGDTRIEFRDLATAVRAPQPAPPAALQLSGSLAAAAAPVAFAEATAEEADAEDGADGEESVADARRATVAGRKALTRAALLAGMAAMVLVGVQVFGGRVRDDRRAAHDEVEAHDALLAEYDRPSEQLDRRLADFVQRFPQSRLRPGLEHVVEARRAQDVGLTRQEAELDALMRNTAGRPESEVVGRLRSLESRVPKDSSLSRRVVLARDDAARRLLASIDREWAVTEADADRSLARGDASAALRRLAAFEASHVALAQTAEERLAGKRKSVQAGATKLADVAIAQAEAQRDPDARRAALLGALRGLEDTAEAERIAAALHGVSGGALPVPGAPASQVPAFGTPAPAAAGPTASAAALVDAAEAERLGRERKWAAAVEVYRRVLSQELPARIQAEWTERAADLARVARLVDDLAAFAVAAGEHPPHVKLQEGTFELLGADGARVRLRRGDKETSLPWASAPAPELLDLLSCPKATADRHLALAILAADLGQRAEAVAHLLALVEDPAHREDAFRVMARRLEGRTSVPEGGYQAFEGELLDKAEYAKRVEARHVAGLEAEAAQLVAKVAAEPFVRAIEKVRARRDELDRRRAYALLAIFNEKQWPYPHDDPAIQTAYAAVTQEVQNRWKAVEEVWNEPLAAKLPKGAAWEKGVERHRAIVQELESKGRDVAALVRAMAPYDLWVGETAITVRNFARDAAEKELLAYNRGVMDAHNPTMTAVATDPEREEVRITNEYRSMMGWSFGVESGPMAVEKLDNANVIANLDQARETGRTPLKALRLDDRLVRSARAHSVDMQRRGFFLHEAPANPATGEGPTMPWDRMGKAGYKGAGASENITAGRGSPLDAHLSWLHSSGHHRNILSNWDDLGVGQSGGLWTQNFGTGGGTPTVIPGREKPGTTDDPDAK